MPRVLPIVIPELEEVRDAAQRLHAKGKHWAGDMFGWPAEYTPQAKQKPVASRMRFTPADFWIGESGIWFFSLMWERGRNEVPVEFLDSRGIMPQKKR